MDLRTFDFPKLSQVEKTFPILQTDQDLLQEAKARGMYCQNTVYNKLFSTYFFKGGTVKFKENLDEDFKQRAWEYLYTFM